MGPFFPLLPIYDDSNFVSRLFKNDNTHFPVRHTSAVEEKRKEKGKKI